MSIGSLIEKFDKSKVGNCTYIGDSNVFFSVNQKEIQMAEELLGYNFPPQLREFYQQIGYGCLTTPHNPPKEYNFFNSNEILPPLVAARFAKGILHWEGQEHWMSEDIYQFLEAGDLPFFEIADSTLFFIMKAKSDNPNAVWDYMFKISDSFEEFIFRLYYESPCFYENIIAKYLDKKAVL